MTSTLSQNLTRIKNATDRIRTVVDKPTESIEDVAYAVENMPTGGGIPQVASIQEMRALTAHDGDLCVLYNEELEPVTDYIKIESFVRDYAVSYVDLYFEPSVKITDSVKNTYYELSTCGNEYCGYDCDIGISADSEDVATEFHFLISGHFNSNYSIRVEARYTLDENTGFLNRGNIVYYLNGSNGEAYEDTSSGWVHLPSPISFKKDSAGIVPVSVGVGSFIKSHKWVPWEKETYSDILVFRPFSAMGYLENPITGTVTNYPGGTFFEEKTNSYVFPSGYSDVTINSEIKTVETYECGILNAKYTHDSDGYMRINEVSYSPGYDAACIYNSAAYSTGNSTIDEYQFLTLRLSDKVSFIPDSGTTQQFDNTVGRVFYTYYYKPVVYRYSSADSEWKVFLR